MSISILQAVFADDGGATGTTQTVTLTNVQKGSTIHVFVTKGGNTGTVTVADPTNGSYNAVTDAIFDATNTQYAAQCYKANVAAVSGSLVITGTFSLLSFKGLCAVEIGQASTSPLDGHTSVIQSAPGAGTDAITVGPPSPNNANNPAIVLAMSFTDSGTLAPTNGTGYTPQGTGWNFGGANALAAVESKVVTGASAAATFTSAAGAGNTGGKYLNLVSIYDQQSSLLPTDAIFFGMT